MLSHSPSHTTSLVLFSSSSFSFSSTLNWNSVFDVRGLWTKRMPHRIRVSERVRHIDRVLNFLAWISLDLNVLVCIAAQFDKMDDARWRRQLNSVLSLTCFYALTLYFHLWNIVHYAFVEFGHSRRKGGKNMFSRILFALKNSIEFKAQSKTRTESTNVSIPMPWEMRTRCHC